MNTFCLGDLPDVVQVFKLEEVAVFRAVSDHILASVVVYAEDRGFVRTVLSTAIRTDNADPAANCKAVLVEAICASLDIFVQFECASSLFA